jgi:hypothetical protein
MMGLEPGFGLGLMFELWLESVKVLVGIGVKVWGVIKVGVVDLIGNPVVTVDATFSIPFEKKVKLYKPRQM